MPSKSAGTSRQQNGLLQPPSAIDTDDAAADATAQPADVLELAGCAKFHRGKWDMELLQAHTKNKNLMTEAEAAVLQLTPEMLSFGRDLLRGLQEPVINLSLALCTSRRGAGGRTTEPDPFSNPRMDPTAAQRVANKRRTAAFSKFKSKVASLAEAAAKAGLLPGKASGASHTGALASSNPAATEAAAASAAAAEAAVPNISYCRLERALESSSPSAAAVDIWGRPGNSPFRCNSAPAGTAAASADTEAPAASAAGADVAGEDVLMQDALMQLDLFGAAGNQHKKRPPQRAQTHRVFKPQPRRCVKRHKSQQLLGSAASTEVANSDGSVFACQQQGVLASQVSSMSGPYTPSASRFGAACRQLASAQLCTVRTISAGSPAAGPGFAGFTDVYTQLAPADAADAIAEAAVHSQQPHCGSWRLCSWQHQVQSGKQSCTAAGGPAHAASEPQPVLFDLPVQVEATAGSKGFDDDAWLLEDFDILGSPTLADLLLACSPAASPRAGSWDCPQLRCAPDLAQAPKDSLTPAQHSNREAQLASAAVLGAVGAGAGPVTATPAADLPGQQPAAAHVLANAPQTPAHFRLELSEVSAAAAGLPAAWHYCDAVAAMQGHHLGVSGLPGYVSTGTATAGPAQQAMPECPAAGAQHTGLSAAQPGFQGTGPAQAGPSAGAGHPAAGRGNSHAAAAAAAYGPAGAASGLGTAVMQSAVCAKGAQNSFTRTLHFGVTGGHNRMTMPVLSRRSSPAALSPMGSAGYACSSTDMLSPARHPPARHASTADLRQSTRGAPAGRQLQELQEGMSVGCMHEQLALAGIGLHAGLSCMPHGMPSTAGGHHGSVLAMGLPAGQPLRPCASWNGPVLAGGNNSSSPRALQDGTTAQHMAHKHTYGPTTGQTAAPAAVWPVTRMSPLQALHQAAAAGHGVPAAAAAPNNGAPQAQSEPAYSAAAGMMGFVADVLRASNGLMATAAKGILPVLAAAAAQGHTVAPALKQLQIALLEVQLQQHQAQLLGMMGDAAAGQGEATRDRETSAIASTLCAITEMGLENAASVHSGISYFAQGAPPHSAHQAGVPLSEALNPAVPSAGACMQLGDAAYLASFPGVAPAASMAGRSGGFFGNQPGM